MSHAIDISKPLACCGRQNINHMQCGGVLSAICNACGTHWYGPDGEVQQYTRQEWDWHLDVRLRVERTDTRESHLICDMAALLSEVCARSDALISTHGTRLPDAEVLYQRALRLVAEATGAQS